MKSLENRLPIEIYYHKLKNNILNIMETYLDYSDTQSCSIQLLTLGSLDQDDINNQLIKPHLVPLYQNQEVSEFGTIFQL